MPDQAQIAEHYDQPDLIAVIERGFAKAGKPVAELTLDDLSVVDEFHTGGRAATEMVMGELDLAAGSSVLDIGCGLGGPARYCASRYGCTVTGIDVARSYVEAATALTGWVGLSDKVSFLQRSAHELVGDETVLAGGLFDAAYLFHVGMNVKDKNGLFAGAAEVLAPGGRFAVYDLMRTDTGQLTYPLPWASTEATSFVEAQATYETGLVANGFELVAVRDRTEIATAFLEMISAANAASGAEGAPASPPPVGLHLLMGAEAPTKLTNLIAALSSGLLAPIEIIAQRS